MSKEAVAKCKNVSKETVIKSQNGQLMVKYQSGNCQVSKRQLDKCQKRQLSSVKRPQKGQ